MSPEMDQSLFDRLPPELRNCIYGLLLPEAMELKVHIYRGAKPTKDEKAKNANADIFALAQTCKDIAKEAQGMFYGHHAFVIVVQPFYLTAAGTWVPKQPPTLRAVWTKEVLAFLRSIAVLNVKPLRLAELHCRGTSHLARGEDYTAAEWGKMLQMAMLNTLQIAKAGFPADTQLSYSLDVDSTRWFGATTYNHLITIPTAYPDGVGDDGLVIKTTQASENTTDPVDLASAEHWIKNFVAAAFV